MSEITLQVQKREASGTGQVSQLRDAHVVPCVMYSKGEPAVNLQVNEMEFKKVYEQAGESTIIIMQVEGGDSVPVLVHDMQKDPLSDRILHVDFYIVDMTKKLQTEVPLEFVGEAAAIKTHGALVTHSADTVQIECLPTDLPSSLEVDVTVLADIGQSLRASDLALPSGVTLLSDPETLLAIAEMPKEEKEEEIAPADAEAAAVEAAAGDEGGEGEGEGDKGAEGGEEKKEE